MKRLRRALPAVIAIAAVLYPLVLVSGCGKKAPPPEPTATNEDPAGKSPMPGGGPPPKDGGK